MELDKVYKPAKYEHDIYRMWENSGAFEPKHRGDEATFSMVLPPPNANGNLHVGHSLMFAVQDVVARYHRMKGKSVLWLPGADHAGFETQVVYEKQLAKKGKSRFDLSREELYDQIWEFVALNRDNYQAQYRRLGASVDWNHFTFTLDKKIIKQAYQTFKQMWDDKLIYRGERLVNFCTFHGTAFADIEVVHKNVDGHLWHITYPLTDGSGEIVVATTRPETMLGDTAVAVNPTDKRYAKFIGKTAKLPLVGREIPIIADDMVDPEFGTGAVKITPAHDPNDYEAGKRHNLPFITVVGHDGTMTPDAGKDYRGITVDQARKKVAADLKTAGFLLKTDDYSHNVGHCYKCGTVIQPLLKEQWFVDMQPLAKKAISTLKNNKIKFYPAAKQDQLITYLEGLRDWNISRQIAWGIPIPAFVNIDDPDEWIYDERVTKETIGIDGKTYKRDPDVFDTWFSSSSWPYATLGYPDSPEYKQFYPNSLMETGGEILYPWVSRMIMLGLYVTGEIPFKTVYIHGYVLATDGAKMSKSIGNVIDPMEIVDKYGSDALRMGLLAGRAPGVNRGFDLSKVEGARNFCNKLWNIARFTESKLGNTYSPKEPTPQTIADYWVLNVLQQLEKNIASFIEKYQFTEAYDELYHRIWDDIADWYIEASKNQQGSEDMLAYVLETILKIAHPFAPFVTEAIWQSLAWYKQPLITTAWPKVAVSQKAKATEFEEIKELVTEVRQLSKNLKLSRPTLTYKTSPLLKNNAHLITKLAGIGGTEANKTADGVRLLSAEAWLEVDAQHLTDYKTELQANINNSKQQISNLQKRLSNKAYVKNAPESVVTETKDQLAISHAELKLQQKELTRL